MKILQNEAVCLKCNDQIYSAHRHDFKHCKCENIFVDGGMEYIRHGFTDAATYKNVSVGLEDDVFDESIEALKWAKDNNRNELGALCAIFRAFRKCGYELTKKEEE